jgi:predicted nucleic acid-binding protein
MRTSVAALVDTNVLVSRYLWAHAERFGLEQLLSEDFQHGRLYGTVEAVDPFV